MNFPEQQFPEKDIETLAKIEREASQRLLQQITLDYSTARARDAVEGGYLQRMVAVTPVETVAFREDSKKQYLVDDNSIARKSIYVYVEPIDDNYWVERAWIKRVNEDGTEEGVFEIDKVRGRRLYEADPSRVSIQDINSMDILKELAVKAISQKRASIAGMSRLSTELRDDYRVVPFDP